MLSRSRHPASDDHPAPWKYLPPPWPPPPPARTPAPPWAGWPGSPTTAGLLSSDLQSPAFPVKTPCYSSPAQRWIKFWPFETYLRIQKLKIHFSHQVDQRILVFSAAFKGAGQGAVYCARPGKVDPPKIMTFFLQFYQKISRREFLSENFYCARQEKVNPPKIMTMVQFSWMNRNCIYLRNANHIFGYPQSTEEKKGLSVQ